MRDLRHAYVMHRAFADITSGENPVKRLRWAHRPDLQLIFEVRHPERPPGEGLQ